MNHGATKTTEKNKFDQAYVRSFEYLQFSVYSVSPWFKN